MRWRLRSRSELSDNRLIPSMTMLSRVFLGLSERQGERLLLSGLERRSYPTFQLLQGIDQSDDRDDNYPWRMARRYRRCLCTTRFISHQSAPRIKSYHLRVERLKPTLHDPSSPILTPDVLVYNNLPTWFQ